jgi:hypothetical protein
MNEIGLSVTVDVGRHPYAFPVCQEAVTQPPRLLLNLLLQRD